MKTYLAAAGALGMLASAAHGANEAAPSVFKPAGPWAAEYGDDYCRLARSFSNGSDTLSLAMERIQPGIPLRVILVGNGMNMYRGTDQLQYTLAPSGEDRKGPVWRSETSDKQQYINLGEILMTAPGAAAPAMAAPTRGERPPVPAYDRAAEQEYAKGINAISFTGGLTDPVQIETGGLKAPIASLQACTDDLLKVWGLDPAQHQTMKNPALPSNEASKWLPSGTIGFGDFGKIGGAANQFRVMVSAEGKPTACTVHWASLDKKTNDAICQSIMNKAEFFPALDKDGNPMPSYWVTAPFGLMPPPRGT